MIKQIRILITLLIVILFTGLVYRARGRLDVVSEPEIFSVQEQIATTFDEAEKYYIETLKKRNYPESEIIIEETLAPGINYQRYIASYTSDNLKIYGLFTVPKTEKPQKGFASIIFLHGYLDPKVYQTTERYVAYQDGFARNGFITFKPDLRGHGKSEGAPVNSNFSQDYVIDTLNLISALKIYKDVNPLLLGMWGHSNGGGITLRAMEVSKEIKAAVIWAGVVGNYEDLLLRYRRKIPWINNRQQLTSSSAELYSSPESFVQKYGEPDLKSPFWSKVDPYFYMNDITTPVQLHHGTADTSVPVDLSVHFRNELEKAGKMVELYEYQGADHNIAGGAFSLAMERSVLFFKKYLQ